MMDERFQQHMHAALDGELSELEQQFLQEQLADSPDATDEWQRLQNTDKLLRETPPIRPAAEFANRVMAAIAALPLPDLATRPLSVGLALGLAAAALLTLPLLSAMVIVLLASLADPGTLNALLQGLLNGASYLIGLAVDVQAGLQNILDRSPLLLMVPVALIPLTALWAWLMWRLFGGPRPAKM